MSSDIERVTLIISTFERPAQLDRLLESIRVRYPRIPILIADDGVKPRQLDGYAVYALPFDRGVSAKRNLLLSQVDTDYFVTLDDDYLFTDQTSLERMLPLMMAWDIAAGHVEGDEFAGKLVREGDTLRYERGGNSAGEVDIASNFFMARTESVRAIGWRNELKLAEHTDFFLRARHLKVCYVPEVRIGHQPGGNPRYLRFRDRAFAFKRRFMELHGLRRLIEFDGSEATLENIRSREEMHRAWVARLDTTCELLAEYIPAGKRFVLIDEGNFGSEVIAERKGIPFPAGKDGHYEGVPPDGETAVRELESLLETGVMFVAVLWPAFWWLEYFDDMRSYLASNLSCILRTDDAILFSRRTPP